MENRFMKWKEDEWLNLGSPLPPSMRSWPELLQTVAKQQELTKDSYIQRQRQLSDSDNGDIREQLSDSDGDDNNGLPRLGRYLDDDILDTLSYRHNGTLYFDGGTDHSMLISDRFLEVETAWCRLEELVLLYCHFPASSISQFLHTATRQQRPWRGKGLVVQLKPFFGDCDFSYHWFSRALGVFRFRRLAKETSKSVEFYNQRYGMKPKYQLQCDPSRSGRVFSAFCTASLPVDLWIIDQDDAPESLFFWENFDENKWLHFGHHLPSNSFGDPG
ncbi:hypothetical protein BT69DRAFT_1360816 [Atractiella rhizophila]|nr:hypothetical protein BT69DRAFT_1360816 [Atractiella rhizophila]